MISTPAGCQASGIRSECVDKRTMALEFAYLDNQERVADLVSPGLARTVFLSNALRPTAAYYAHIRYRQLDLVTSAMNRRFKALAARSHMARRRKGPS